MPDPTGAARERRRRERKAGRLPIGSALKHLLRHS